MTRYTLYVTPAALREIKELPGHVRQRVRRTVASLREDPRPAESRPLRAQTLDTEVRRIRLSNWRIVYMVSEGDQAVDVLAVRRRPPYDYGDLASLLEQSL